MALPLMRKLDFRAWRLASVQQVEGEPIWDVVARWLRAQGRVRGIRPNQPDVMGLQNNQGIV